MYTTEVRLNNDEIPAKVNIETGETSLIKKRPNNIPEGKEVWLPNAKFMKTYTKSWIYLEDNLSPLEFQAAYRLGMKAKAFTNSLEPLNDETTIPELVEVLGVSKNVVKRVINKLFSLGVFGKFEVAEDDKPYTKYWIFNPFLSFNGKLVDSDIANLFRNTKVAKAFKGEI